MPLMETVTVLNKSGKVVSTGKHLVNIFKDAKDAYLDRKAEIKAEHRQRLEYKLAQKLLIARAAEDTQSIASSRRSRKSRRYEDADGISRPPLTERHLTQIAEGSVTGSQRVRSSQGSKAGSKHGRHGHRSPHVEDDASHHPNSLRRRHTECRTETIPPPHTSQIIRSHSNPNLRSIENIDMNLAYGNPPPELQIRKSTALQEAELVNTMSKLDNLLLEAQCMQHSATTIMKNLQENPEAMAAVALTLAELSNLLTKASPAILTALKSSSPVVFALLASPQFLIAGGVALGVTVVMFGGYKIIKKIQANDVAKKEANMTEQAIVWDGQEVSSIESWRRGISAADGMGDDGKSEATSVDGEFITPEAARQKKERAKERRREDRRRDVRSSGWTGEETRIRTGSVAGRGIRSDHTPGKGPSDGTSMVRSVSTRDNVVTPVGGGESHDDSKGKNVVKEKGKKPRKTSALSVIFHKSKDVKGKKDKDSSRSTHHPKMIELSS